MREQTIRRTPTVREIMDSPEISYWLKDALTSSLGRDPVDAKYDADLLAEILTAELRKYFPHEEEV